MKPKIVITFLSIISMNFFEFSEELFSKPELTNPLIPLKWRQLCGHRFMPKIISQKNNTQCFQQSFDDIVLPNPIQTIQYTQSTTNRIFKGRAVAYRESPWTVQIVIKRSGTAEHHCTGVLITMKHILTAAHCYRHGIEIELYASSDRTAGGLHGPLKWPVHVSGKDFIVYHHPHYFVGGVMQAKNDIAMIILNRELDWDKYGRVPGSESLYLNTVCLPKPDYPLQEGYQNATLFGWGVVRDAEVPQILQRGDFSISYQGNDGVPFPYPNFFDVNIKDPTNRQRVCPGDSGSGLVQYVDKDETRAVLIGIHQGSSGPPGRSFCEDVNDQDHSVIVAKHLELIYHWLEETA